MFRARRNLALPPSELKSLDYSPYLTGACPPAASIITAARAAGVSAAAAPGGICRRLARRTSFLFLRIWSVVSSRRRRPSSTSMDFLKPFLRCEGEGVWGGGR